MLYLISTNVYNSVDAPSHRGFSYIEVWQVGAQLPILIALFEYGFVLFLKKGGYGHEISQNEDSHINERKQNLDVRIRQLDYATMTISFLFFLIFGSLYWIILIFK